MGIRDRSESSWRCNSRISSWVLAMALGASVSNAQWQFGDFGESTTEEEHWNAEHEKDRRFERNLAESRELAHSRLEDLASTIQSEALCPAFLGPGPQPRSFRKRVTRPFTARFAPPPVRTPWRGVAPEGGSPSVIFGEFISSQIVQSRCIHCHVEGGASGHTRLVFTSSEVEMHEAENVAVLESFLATVEGGADLILNKIQGAEGHGGGIQVVPGSPEFANMERFLRALGGDVSGGLSPETLFEGVTMASPGRTLRRAALLFAGRLPTQTELDAVSNGDESTLRRTIRGLMTGPGFHQFLIRGANDRLLTDRDRRNVIRVGEFKFVDLANKRYELLEQGVKNGYDPPGRAPASRMYEWSVQLGLARAPLELIASVVEDDLPYTEILTADYIMANPMAALAYGADSEFDDPDDAGEFKPAEILSYYRRHGTQKVEQDPVLGRRVIDPGILSTDYPHAGILNTTVFLKRYPTTPTNRNRARSRWTYYHFLGFDIEKSAARTTDPDALADTNNPTMNNSACTVCHIPMDPVAGAFQNYGDVGLYRDQYGGKDSLPKLYKFPTDGTVSPYQDGDTWFRDMREPGFNGDVAPSADSSLQWLAQKLIADERFAVGAVKFWWPAIMGVQLTEPPEESSDPDFQALRLAAAAQALEVGALADAFREGIEGGEPYNGKDLLTEIALSPWFRAESVTGIDEVRATALRDAGVARLLTPEELASKTDAVAGYVWGRRIHLPSGATEPVNRLDPRDRTTGYGLLYGGIDSDGITERAGDLTSLMAAVAQSHAAEVSCPIVYREFFYWPDGNRLLFNGITKLDTPLSEATREFAVTAESWDARQTVSMEVALAAGSKAVHLAYTNNNTENARLIEEGLDHLVGDRNLILDSMVVRDSAGNAVFEIELETHGRQDCGRGRGQYYKMSANCSLRVPVQVASNGVYTVEVRAHQDRAGDDHARLQITLESEDGTSNGALAIRRKLAELHQRLFGVTVALDSPDVKETFDLFVEVWNRKRSTENQQFSGSGLACSTMDDHLYFAGVADAALKYSSAGNSLLESSSVKEFEKAIDKTDPQHAVRTWVVTLAFLLTDHRYLYF